MDLKVKRTWKRAWAPLAALVLGAGGAAAAGPGAALQEPPVHRSTAEDRESVSVTVYNQNFGLVREVRAVELAEGRVALEYADVAASIETPTVHVASLAAGGPLRVLEQNYRYDLLSPETLLEKYVGRTVLLYRGGDGVEAEEPVEAELLSTQGGTILRIGDEITFEIPGRLAFPEVPEDLIARPTLVWLVESGARSQRLETSYLAGELNWRADYVMVLDEDDRQAGMTGWVTLTNESGATWENAELKLVAGDVQRIRDRAGRVRVAPVTFEAARDEAFAEEAFFEYHLYTLARPTTLRNREQKQVTLLEAHDFGVEKSLVLRGQPRYYRNALGEVASDLKVDVLLSFENSAENGLGMPLPAGIVRVYKADASGARQFVGEDRIDHTPRDERLHVRMGQAFDVVADRRQAEYTVQGRCASQSLWEIHLRNHKDEDVTVQVVEPLGGDWDILHSSHAPETVDARTVRFRVPVAARDEARLTYRVQVRWC